MAEQVFNAGIFADDKAIVRSARWIIAAAVFVFSVSAFGPRSDAVLSVQDGAYYGRNAERGATAQISGHHPLHHVLALPLARLFRLFGGDHPGLTAVQVLSGLGGAGLVLAVTSLAGARRRWGLIAALGVVGSRVVLLESATGETLTGAAALVLAAYAQAARPGPRLGLIGVLFTLALLYRADHVLLLPGLLLILGARIDRPLGRRRLLIFTAAVGMATALGYVLIWSTLIRPAASLDDWILDITEVDWNLLSGQSSILDRVRVHLGALAPAWFGRFWPLDEPMAGWAATIFLPLAAGWLGRGRAPQFAVVGACGLTVILRFVFYVRFEAHNPEWHLLTIVMAFSSVAAVAHGIGPRHPRWSRFGALILALVVLVVAGAHRPSTLRLRDERLVGAVLEARRAIGDDVRYVAQGGRVALAMDSVGLRNATCPTAINLSLLGWVAKRLGDDPRPMAVIFDRVLEDGMPFGRDHVRPLPIDSPEIEGLPHLRAVKNDRGVVHALVFSPPK